MTLESITQFATTIGVIASLLAMASQIKKNRHSIEFETFNILLEKYHKIVQDRREQWKRIKDKLRENPKTAQEVHDRQNTLDYLELRKNQSEPLFAIEHGLLEREILSLNFLNELCLIASENPRCKRILILSESSEISYYKSHKDRLLGLFKNERLERKLPKPQFNFIDSFDVKELFIE